MTKYRLPIFISLAFIMFFAFFSVSEAVSLIEAPVVNGVVNSTWQYQGSVKGIAWYTKNGYFSNADGSLQFASSADFSVYLAGPTTSPVTPTLTSDVPMGPNGVLNPGWQDQGGGWYFKNPNYSDAYGSIQFGSLAELNAYLAAEQAKKVNIALPPATGCTGYETTPACRPEWAEAVKSCIPGSLVVTNNATNGQCLIPVYNSNVTSKIIQTCNAIINDGPCRPERVNPYAAAGIAKKAETTAKVKGYSNTSCSAEKVYLGADMNLDPNTGLNYYYNITCTINGKTGIGAEWMVNGSTYFWQNLSDFVNGKGDYSSVLKPKADGSSGTTPPASTGGGSSTGTPASTPAPTASVENLNNTISSIKNQSISYIRELMNTYTKKLDDANPQDSGLATNANALTTTGVSTVTQTQSSSCSGSLNTDLKKGDDNVDVSALTSYLSSKGFYQTPQSSFDQTVFDAVVAFQNANKDTILTPVGLSSGTGFVGASTRKFINSEICPMATTNGKALTPVDPFPSKTKAVFTSNVSGVMHVGDSWNIVVTGLNPNETIYATGGKKVNGVVPQDKTPYYADNLGIYSKISSHAPDVVGDWQLVWNRADGTNLGILNFSVVPFVLPYITSVSSNTLKSGDTIQISGGNIVQGVTLAELVNQQGAIVSLTLGNVSSNLISATLPLGMTPGNYNLQLRFVGTGVNFGKTSNTVSVTVTK